MAQCASDDFMMHAMIWASGVENAASNDDETGPDGCSPVEQAEAFILGRPPRNAVEMIIQLEIICHDLDEGHRTDGLDVLAIRNVQRALLDDLLLQPDDVFTGFLSARDALASLHTDRPSTVTALDHRGPQPQLSGGGRCGV